MPFLGRARAARKWVRKMNKSSMVLFRDERIRVAKSPTEEKDLSALDGMHCIVSI